MRSEQDFPWLPFGLVLFVALVLRLVQLNHAPHFDEFYHLLSANSLLADGDLCIAECLRPYNRGALFTYLVAGAIGLFGHDLIVGRLVSVVAGMLLVAGVFWWTWRVAGRTAAWVAALLLALSPEAIYVSQLIRFYSLHALLVWLGGAALFLAVHPQPGASIRLRVALFGMAILALAGALSLQVTTLIALAGFGVWILIDPVTTRAVRLARHGPGQLMAIATVSVVIAMGVALVTIRSGLLDGIWMQYRSANLLVTGRANDIRYYHNFLLDSYPTAYSLLPIAFVIALWKRPAATKFTGAIFGVALVLQSGGGFKAIRFLFYSMPFFFALWGIAIASVLPPLVSAAREAAAEWIGTTVRARAVTMVSAVLLGLMVVGVFATNSAYNTTLKMVTLSDADWPSHKPIYRGRPDWRPAVAALRELSNEAAVLVTTTSVKSLYYLGRSDAELSVSRLFQRPGFAPDFSLDPRIGSPVLKSVEAMALVIGCYDSGVIVLEVHGALVPSWNVLPETLAYIIAHTDEIRLPPGSDLRAFRWNTDTQAPSDACNPAPLSRAGPGQARG